MYQVLIVLVRKDLRVCAKSFVHVLKALGVEIKPESCCCTVERQRIKSTRGSVKNSTIILTNRELEPGEELRR